MIDQYGWEPFQHWFCEPGDIPGENRSSCSFRNWWQANVGVGGSGVPLWRLPPKKVTQIERGKPIDEHLCDVCGKKFLKRKSLTDHINRVHRQPIQCSLCCKVFSCKYVQKRHLQEVHNRDTPQINCDTCNKSFQRTEHLKAHKAGCEQRKMKQNEIKDKEKQNKNHSKISLKVVRSKNRKSGYCVYCKKSFKRIENFRIHQERGHIVRQKSGSFMMFRSVIDKFKKRIFKKVAEYICYICPILRRYKTKQNLQRHQRIIHKGLHNTMRGKNLSIQFSKEELNKLSSRTVECYLCNKSFSCIQNQQEHLQQEHDNNRPFKCVVCNKSFMKQTDLKFYKKRVHCQRLFSCTICQYKFKTKCHLDTHIKVHFKQKDIKEEDKICNKQIKRRAKKESTKIKSILEKNSSSARQMILKELISENMDFVNSIETNPLTEDDVIEIIQDNNLSDRAMLKIVQKLTEKWGKENVITKNIGKKLVKRKKILDQFLTKQWLDDNSELYFKSKEGKPIGRWVAYCHDVPGLLAFKMLVENPENPDELFNVISADDGKGILKITCNWSCLKPDEGKHKFMSAKRSIILAAVCEVPESYHNMGVLFKLTSLNEVEYKLSQDLKLSSIVIGITNHSSKYPCPYGECFKDELTGQWVKGQDRTIKNLTENQKKWYQSVAYKKGDRTKLKFFKNVEHKPLIEANEDTPIIQLIPPPPLHLLLLGPINDIMRKLQELHPPIIKTIEKLHIQRSKYQGKNFEGRYSRKTFVMYCIILYPII